MLKINKTEILTNGIFSLADYGTGKVAVLEIVRKEMNPQSLFDNFEDIALANHLNTAFDQVLIHHNITENLDRVKRDDKDSFTQTIFQVRELPTKILLLYMYLQVTCSYLVLGTQKKVS